MLILKLIGLAILCLLGLAIILFITMCFYAMVVGFDEWRENNEQSVQKKNDK